MRFMPGCPLLGVIHSICSSAEDRGSPAYRLIRHRKTMYGDYLSGFPHSTNPQMHRPETVRPVFSTSRMVVTVTLSHGSTCPTWKGETNPGAIGFWMAVLDQHMAIRSLNQAHVAESCVHGDDRESNWINNHKLRI